MGLLAILGCSGPRVKNIDGPVNDHVRQKHRPGAYGGKHPQASAHAKYFQRPTKKSSKGSFRGSLKGSSQGSYHGPAQQPSQEKLRHEFGQERWNQNGSVGKHTNGYVQGSPRMLAPQSSQNPSQMSVPMSAQMSGNQSVQQVSPDFGRRYQQFIPVKNAQDVMPQAHMQHSPVPQEWAYESPRQIQTQVFAMQQRSPESPRRPQTQDSPRRTRMPNSPRRSRTKSSPHKYPEQVVRQIAPQGFHQRKHSQSLQSKRSQLFAQEGFTLESFQEWNEPTSVQDPRSVQASAQQSIQDDSYLEYDQEYDQDDDQVFDHDYSQEDYTQGSSQESSQEEYTQGYGSDFIFEDFAQESSRERLVRMYETHDEEVDKEIYQKAFPCDVEYPEYDLKMFRQRAKARLYVYAGGKIRVIRPDLSHAPHKKSRGSFIRSALGPILQIEAAYPSPFLLNARGEVYAAQVWGEKLRAYRSKTRTTLSDITIKTDYEEEYKDTKFLHFWKSYYEEGEPQFEHITGNQVEVDSTGHLWTWPKGSSGVGVPLLLADGEFAWGGDNLITAPISKIETGNQCVCTVKGKGMFVWQGMEFQPLKSYSASLFASANVRTVRGLVDEIIDYVITGDWMFCLLTDHSLSWIATKDLWDLQLSMIHPVHMVNMFKEEAGHFVSIVSSPGKLGLLCETGCIVVVNLWDEINHGQTVKNVRVIPTLRGRSVSKISIGPSQGLALTKEGLVYQWKPDGIPSLLKLPGRAYDVSVGPGCSVVLACPERSSLF